MLKYQADQLLWINKQCKKSACSDIETDRIEFIIDNYVNPVYCNDFENQN